MTEKEVFDFKPAPRPEQVGAPSQSWKTFLRNHAQAIGAIDLWVVPTLTFERLFAFLVMGHSRRQLRHRSSLAATF